MSVAYLKKAHLKRLIKLFNFVIWENERVQYTLVDQIMQNIDDLSQNVEFWKVQILESFLRIRESIWIKSKNYRNNIQLINVFIQEPTIYFFNYLWIYYTTVGEVKILHQEIFVRAKAYAYLQLVGNFFLKNELLNKTQFPILQKISGNCSISRYFVNIIKVFCVNDWKALSYNISSSRFGHECHAIWYSTLHKLNYQILAHQELVILAKISVKYSALRWDKVAMEFKHRRRPLICVITWQRYLNPWKSFVTSNNNKISQRFKKELLPSITSKRIGSFRHTYNWTKNVLASVIFSARVRGKVVWSQVKRIAENYMESQQLKNFEKFFIELD